MANLGAGIISTVGSQNVKLTLQQTPVAGAINQLSPAIMATTATPIVYQYTGSIAQVLNRKTTNTFKTR